MDNITSNVRVEMRLMGYATQRDQTDSTVATVTLSGVKWFGHVRLRY